MHQGLPSCEMEKKRASRDKNVEVSFYGVKGNCPILRQIRTAVMAVEIAIPGQDQGFMKAGNVQALW